MTRSSIREYTEAVRGRYVRVSKKEKGKILDEFTKVIGCHRKATIRLLRRGNQLRRNKKRGRPRQYGAVVAGALRVAWEATDRLCSKRLHPFLPELVTILRRHSDMTMTTEMEAQLCRMSSSTIDRLLHPWRRLLYSNRSTRAPKSTFEMKRVCKPSGQLLLLEFTRSHNKLVAFIQDLVTPLTYAVYKAHLNRDILTLAQHAGYKIISVKAMGSDIITSLHAVLPPRN